MLFYENHMRDCGYSCVLLQQKSQNQKKREKKYITRRMGEGFVEGAPLKANQFAPGSEEEQEENNIQRSNPKGGFQEKGKAKNNGQNSVGQIKIAPKFSAEVYNTGALSGRLILFVIAVIVHNENIYGQKTDR